MAIDIPKDPSKLMEKNIISCYNFKYGNFKILKMLMITGWIRCHQGDEPGQNNTSRFQDNVLLEIGGGEEGDSPYLVVHPNYIVE